MDIDTLTTEEDENRYQVLITNIAWGRNTSMKAAKRDNDDELPLHMQIDIPDGVLREANKKKSNFNDIIETFCYNLLTKKYFKEVNRCQIWLPLDK